MSPPYAVLDLTHFFLSLNQEALEPYLFHILFMNLFALHGPYPNNKRSTPNQPETVKVGKKMAFPIPRGELEGAQFDLVGVQGTGLCIFETMAALFLFHATKVNMISLALLKLGWIPDASKFLSEGTACGNLLEVLRKHHVRLLIESLLADEDRKDCMEWFGQYYDRPEGTGFEYPSDAMISFLLPLMFSDNVRFFVHTWADPDCGQQTLFVEEKQYVIPMVYQVNALAIEEKKDCLKKINNTVHMRSFCNSHFEPAIFVGNMLDAREYNTKLSVSKRTKIFKLFEDLFKLTDGQIKDLIESHKGPANSPSPHHSLFSSLLTPTATTGQSPVSSSSGSSSTARRSARHSSVRSVVSVSEPTPSDLVSSLRNSIRTMLHVSRPLAAPSSASSAGNMSTSSPHHSAATTSRHLRSQGHTPGISTSHTPGSSTGQSSGSSTGQSSGSSTGQSSGISTSQSSGISTGHTPGSSTSQSSGISKGQSSGSSTGHTPGSSTGQSSGSSKGQSSGSSMGHTPESSTGQSSGISKGQSSGSSTGHTPESSTGHTPGSSKGQSSGSSTGHTPGSSEDHSSVNSKSCFSVSTACFSPARSASHSPVVINLCDDDSDCDMDTTEWNVMPYI